MGVRERNPGLYVDYKRGKYEHWSIAVADLVVILILAVVLFIIGPTIADFFYCLPDPVEGMTPLTITIYADGATDLLLDLILSKRMVGLILDIVVIYFVIKTFRRSRKWRLVHWRLTAWICRGIRWTAAGFLLVDLLVLGGFEPLTEAPLIAGCIELSLTLYRALGAGVFTAVGVLALIIVGCFAIFGWLGKSLQFVLVGLQVGQFLMIEYAGALFDRGEVVILACLGALAGLVHIDTMLPESDIPEEDRWKMKLFGWGMAIVATLLSILVASVSFYLLAWPYFVVVGVIFAQ